MRKFLGSLLLCSMLPAYAASDASGPMKPGLWEMKMKSNAMKSALSPKEMEQMRKDAEKMRKMGLDLSQMLEGNIGGKVCITRQQAEKDWLLGMEQANNGCQLKKVQQSGNSYTADMVCDGPSMKGTGKMKGTVIGNESFTLINDFKGTINGQPVVDRYEQSGKWLSANCGSVKPIGEMMPMQ